MIAAFIINSLLVTAAVLIHYEMLYRSSLLIPKLTIKHRYRVMFGIFGALIAHVVEIWMFAFAYFFMIKDGRFGTLSGNFDFSLLDCSYYSFITYTSLGMGDIYPLGRPIRFLTGLEALTGLVLITWTASFLFLEMQKFWDNK
jgi:hypothetical protein